MTFCQAVRCCRVTRRAARVVSGGMVSWQLVRACEERVGGRGELLAAVLGHCSQSKTEQRVHPRARITEV